MDLPVGLLGLGSGVELLRHLRTGRPRRRKQAGYGRRDRIAGAVSILTRPGVVDRRGRLGDWEVDTLQWSRRGGGLTTFVERRSGGLKTAKLPCSNADKVAYTCIRLLSDCPYQVHTITSDNGGEFAAHADIARALGVRYYFAHTHSLWQRGANENGLNRPYFPMGTGFRKVGQAEIDLALDRLNNRPRKRLAWKTSNQVLIWHQTTGCTSNLNPLNPFVKVVSVESQSKSGRTNLCRRLS